MLGSEEGEEGVRWIYRVGMMILKVEGRESGVGMKRTLVEWGAANLGVRGLLSRASWGRSLRLW